MMRRAERGLGVAIREGQESGEIRKNGEPHSFSSHEKLSPTSIAPGYELREI